MSRRLKIVAILSQLNPAQTLPSYFFKIPFKIILQCTHRSSKASWHQVSLPPPPPPPGPKKTHVNISLLPHTFHITSQSHSPCFHHPNKIWRGVTVMKMLVMQFSPSSSTCHPLCPNTFLSTQLLKHPLSMYIFTAIDPADIYFILYAVHPTVYISRTKLSTVPSSIVQESINRTVRKSTPAPPPYFQVHCRIILTADESFTYELHTAEFYTQGSVHRESNLIVSQQDATVFSLLHFCTQLYMFNAFSDRISTKLKLYIYSYILHTYLLHGAESFLRS